MNLPNLCYLEDCHAGLRFVTPSLHVSEADIIAFATQFDPQPMHTDPIAAHDLFFHGLAASGWHTASLSMRLFVLHGLHPAGGLVGAGVELLEWPRPVRPGDTLHLECEVISTRPSRSKPMQGMVVVRVLTLNQHGETVQVFQPKLVLPKRPPTEPNHE